MGLLDRLRHHTHLAQHAILDAGAPLRRGLQCPRRAALGTTHRNLPEPAVVVEHRLGPGLLDDPETLLERGPVRGVDLVVPVRQGARDAVRLLRHHVDPAPLVAAGETSVRAAARHPVEHRDVLGDPDRIPRRQHDAQLADPYVLRLHADEQVEQHRVVRELEAFDVEVVLGEADRVVAEIVGQPGLLRDLGQHPVVEVAAQAGHALLDLGPGADRGQVEEGDLQETGKPQPPLS